LHFALWRQLSAVQVSSLVGSLLPSPVPQERPVVMASNQGCHPRRCGAPGHWQSLPGRCTEGGWCDELAAFVAYATPSIYAKLRKGGGQSRNGNRLNVGQSQNLTLGPSVTCGRTIRLHDRTQTNVFGVFPKTTEKTTQKNGYWKSILLSLLTLYGKHLDDHWGQLLLWKRG
jgi:hypothetical protein